jgi:hypothetical protein
MSGQTDAFVAECVLFWMKVSRLLVTVRISKTGHDDDELAHTTSNKRFT